MFHGGSTLSAAVPALCVTPKEPPSGKFGASMAVSTDFVPSPCLCQPAGHELFDEGPQAGAMLDERTGFRAALEQRAPNPDARHEIRRVGELMRRTNVTAGAHPRVRRLQPVRHYRVVWFSDQSHHRLVPRSFEEASSWRSVLSSKEIPMNRLMFDRWSDLVVHGAGNTQGTKKSRATSHGLVKEELSSGQCRLNRGDGFPVEQIG